MSRKPGFEGGAHGQADKPDPLCPIGHRFLVQSRDRATEGDFRAWLCRVFGKKKGEAAVVVVGFHDMDGEKWLTDGFRAYLPRSFR